MKFLSDYVGRKYEFEKYGIYDQILSIDSAYFININRLKATKVNEFIESYNKINTYLEDLGKLIMLSDSKIDRTYKKAVEMMKAKEVKGLGLGYAMEKTGAGIGEKMAIEIVDTAKEILEKSKLMPEIFHHIGLFNENIGPDRLSDLISNIIIKDIELYTHNMMEKLNLNKSKIVDISDRGFIINPVKNEEILMVPQEILHELPIAYDYYSLDEVIMKNIATREEFNKIASKPLSRVSESYKKQLILKEIFFKNDKLEDFIERYKDLYIEEYDFDIDPLGYQRPMIKAKEIIEDQKFKVKDIKTSYESAIEICNIFKDLIENNKAYEILYDGKGRHYKETIVQRTFLIMAYSFFWGKNIDISPESDAGRGPVDFKISKGKDKTIIEMKLLSNQQIVHGYTTQIEEYAKAEKTDNKIFLVIININNDDRLLRLKEKEKELKNKHPNKILPKIIYVDSRPKKSASKY